MGIDKMLYTFDFFAYLLHRLEKYISCTATQFNEQPKSKGIFILGLTQARKSHFNKSPVAKRQVLIIQQSVSEIQLNRHYKVLSLGDGRQS